MTISLKKSCDRGARYSWHSGLWTVLWTIALKVFCKMRGKTQVGLKVACLRHVRNIVFYESLSW